MNKITIVLALLISMVAFGQKSSEEYKFFENSNNDTENPNETAKTPSEPGDPVPIDDYIPALAVIGLGMAVYFGRKKVVNAS